MEAATSTITAIGQFVRTSMTSSQCGNNNFTANAFSICAITVGRRYNNMLVVTVYRAPWDNIAETEDLCQQLDLIIIKHSKIIIGGDFNIPQANWTPGRWCPVGIEDVE